MAVGWNCLEKFGLRFSSLAVSAFVFLGAMLALLFVSACPLPEVKDETVESLVLARNLECENGFTVDGATPSVYRPPLVSSLLDG